MGILDQVTQMRNQGKPDEEIVNNLQQQGISPREINDALSQAEIKNAVSGTENANMQPSIMEKSSSPQAPYAPQTQEVGNQEIYTPQPQQEYVQQDGAYQPDTYGEYSPQGIDNTDNIIEIAEQVYSEKIQKIQKQVENMNEFKTLTQTKIENITDRLKKIETTIDKLQIAILEKVGSYGEDLGSIKKEMGMMQDSFGKMVNPIANRIEKRNINQPRNSKSVLQSSRISKTNAPVKTIKKISRRK
ncbi:hypothetical protein CMI49_00840 [Candidatus Pacearchaeota archaeon]|jgi:hypothetical protein|nr:hypothetical protein [Candidatus Pacearchaeota archaeon]|tara:strand:+ start:4478 stop:5212 length:735 start_codon:yes stop_codon:yes gene_type:complete